MTVSEKQLTQLAKQIATAATPEATIYLWGPMGVGKTTFVRAFLRAHGIDDKIKSPTYTLVETYKVDSQHFYHFDFYRINNPLELAYIGLEDYFSHPAICLIEWPEKGGTILPPADLNCFLDYAPQGRLFRLEATTPRGMEILRICKL